MVEVQRGAGKGAACLRRVDLCRARPGEGGDGCPHAPTDELASRSVETTEVATKLSHSWGPALVMEATLLVQPSHSHGCPAAPGQGTSYPGDPLGRSAIRSATSRTWPPVRTLSVKSRGPGTLTGVRRVREAIFTAIPLERHLKFVMQRRLRSGVVATHLGGVPRFGDQLSTEGG